VYIDGVWNGDINNLNGLNQLVNIEGSLIFQFLDGITDLSGLENLSSIGGHLSIEYSSGLTSLAGLENLNSIGGNLSFYNNNVLSDITSLSNLTSIGGGLYMDSNNGLSSLAGLDNVTSIGGDLELFSSYSLTDISSLQALTSVGGSLIVWDTGLTSLNGIENVSSFGGKLKLESNYNLTDISGLQGINIIGGDVTISLHPALENLSGLETLSSIGGKLSIWGNEILTDVNALSNLTTIGGKLSIDYNYMLSDLTGLDNIDANTITELQIRNNDVLSYCGVMSICDYLAGEGAYTIDNNATGCNDSNSILQVCFPSACPQGDIVLNSQQEIEDFAATYPGCAEIPGNLTIKNATDLSGLSQIVTITGELKLENNILPSLNGLHNINSIGTNVILFNNDIVNFNGLNITTTIGNLTITNNNIASFSGSSISEVGGNLTISKNICENFSGLENLTTIGGQLFIGNHIQLTEFTGLENLTSVGTNIELHNNRNLSTISALSGISSMNGKLSLIANNTLTSLTGLENIDANDIQNLIVATNPNLSICSILNVCTYLENDGPHNISGNTQGCNTETEVLYGCSNTNISCPMGDITLTLQQQIDDFASIVNCNSIPGRLIIRGETTTSINNLDGLSQLTSIEGGLEIDANNALTSLSGLENLTTTGYDLIINNNKNLTNLTGLEGITSIDENLSIIGNFLLENLSGLENLTTIGGKLSIISNTNLTYLAGLENLTFVGTNIILHTNKKLITLSALSNVNDMNGTLSLIANNTLDSLTGLENIEPNNIQNLVIVNNPNLSVCSVSNVCTYLQNGGANNISGNVASCNSQAQIEAACMPVVGCPQNNVILTSQQEINDFPIQYPECTEIVGHLIISPYFDDFPADIVDLSPLSQIVSVGGFLRINGNDMLTNLTGLEGIISIGDDIAIYNNNNLTDLNGLINITSVEHDIAIYNNAVLSDLMGLDNVEYTTIDNLYINDNPQLATCNIESICNYLENGGTATINNNASGCNTQAEVQAACMPVTVCPDTFTPFSQEDIDNFPSDYPNCTEIQYLDISIGINITNLDSLAQLTSITGNIEIANTQLTSLWGLHNLTNLGDFLYIYENPNLSICSLPNICDYIESSQEIGIFNNAPGCNSEEEIQLLCDSPCAGTGEATTDSLTHIFDEDLLIDGVGFANNPTVTFTDPGTPAAAVLSDITLELYFRLNGNTCENEIAIQITDPAGNTQPLTAYTTCDGGTGLYYVNLDVPSGNTTGSIADWVVEFNDTNDQNSDYEYSVRFARLNYVANTEGSSGETVVNEVSQIADNDLFIDGVGFENNGTYTFVDPGTPADAILSDISLELYFRLNGASCENEIAIQITDPTGNTQALTAYASCDGGTGLYYINLNIPSGNTTGSAADWVVEFDDTNDQNSDYEYSVRFGRLTYTTTHTGGVSTPVIITDEVVRTADSDLFIDGVGFDNNQTYTFYDPATPEIATLSDISLELYFRLNGASCENEIAIQLTDPAGNTQALTTYMTCDGGTELYYVNLNVPSGSVTGEIAPWIVQFDDTNDQNSDYEYSVRFGRLTYTTQYDLCDTQMMIVEENEDSHQLNTSARSNYNTTTPQHHNTLKLYPVPASQHLNVEYFSENNNPTNIEIISNEGKTLMSQKEFSQEGINTIQLDIADLPAGHYHIRVYNAEDMQMQSFVKIMP